MTHLSKRLCSRFLHTHLTLPADIEYADCRIFLLSLTFRNEIFKKLISPLREVCKLRRRDRPEVEKPSTVAPVSPGSPLAQSLEERLHGAKRLAMRVRYLIEQIDA